MANAQNIVSLGFDIAKFDIDKQHIYEGLMESYNLIKKIAETKINIASGGGWGELKTQITALKTQVTELQEANVKLAQSIADGATKTGGAATRTRELTLEQAKLNESTKQVNTSTKLQAKDALGLVGSYDRLVLAYNNAAKAAKNLTVQYGANHPEALKATQHANALSTQLKQVDSSVGQFQKNVGNYKEGFSSIGNTIKDFATAYIGLIGIQGVGQFLEKTVEEFQQAEKKIASFKNILTNLGREDAFGRLTKQADELAHSLGTIKSEDVVQLFDKLATYGKLSETQMTTLTPVIINFAAKTGRSLEEATDVFTKALEGNAKGFRTMGINIKDAIPGEEGMVDATSRLNLIMKELEPRVRGAAEAFGETAAGGIAKTKVEIDELEKSLGGRLQPLWSNLLAGALKFFDGIGVYIQTLSKVYIRVIEDTVDGVKSLFKGDFAHVFSTSIALQQKRATQEFMKNVGDVQAQADKIVQATIKQTETIKVNGKEVDNSIQRHERLLEGYTSFAHEAVKTYEKLKETGTATSKQLTEEAAKVAKAVAIVAGLREAIAVEKDKGAINPNADGSGGVDKTKLKQISQKFFADELKDQVEALKKGSEAEHLAYLERIKFREDAYALSKILLQKQTESELQQEKDKLDTALGAEKITENGRLNAQNEYNVKVAEIMTKASYERRKAALQLSEDLFIIQVTAAKREKEQRQLDNQLWIDEEKAAADKKAAAIQEGNNRRLAVIADNRDTELAVVNGMFADGILTQKQYEEKKAEIVFEYGKKLIEEKIKIAELAIKADKAAGLNTTAQEAALDALKLSYSDLLTTHKITNEKKIEDATKARHELEKKLAEETFNFVQALVDGGFTRQKNALQSLIDLNNTYSAAETARINNSTLTEQDKAAKLIQLQASTNAKNVQFAKEQKDLDIKKAKFDKAVTIAKIFETNALAIVKYASDPITLPLLPWIEEIGLIELATAIATPIPTYAEGAGVDGKPAHPGGGAVVGEKGPELIQPKGGKSFLADRPMLLNNLPAGSRVIPLTQEIVNEHMHGGVMISMSERIAIAERLEKRGTDDAWKIARWTAEQTRAAMEASKQDVRIINKIDFDPSHTEWVNKYVLGK